LIEEIAREVPHDRVGQFVAVERPERDGGVDRVIDAREVVVRRVPGRGFGGAGVLVVLDVAQLRAADQIQIVVGIEIEQEG